MPFDPYMNIGGIKGESFDTHNASVEVVRSGENSLSQVANRLGIHEEHLASANPQIKDFQNLKVGQEIHLPTQPPVAKSEPGCETQPGTPVGKDLPKAPIGDPLTVMQMIQSLAEKEARLNTQTSEISKVGELQQEAQEKYQNARDAATTGMTLGSVGGSGSQSGSTVQDISNHAFNRRVSKP